MTTCQARQGRLVVLEGPDGVGKTTLADQLVDKLKRTGVDAQGLSFPGLVVGTLGELVYRVHHDPTQLGVTKAIHPAAVQMLHIAAHVDAIESTIRPALGAGRWVVLDRYWWSTWVYGRAAGVSQRSLDRMIDVEATHWNDDRPDPVFLITRTKSQVSRQLTSLYETLATREAESGRVNRVRNDGTAADAVAAMVATLTSDDD